MTYSQQLAEHVALFKEMDGLDLPFRQVASQMVGCLKNAGGALFLCGNGGSAAAAQHLAAELTGRFVHDRPPLAAIALTTDTSALTAIANDYGYDQVFARQLRALGTEADLLVVLSTSGNSPNIVEAAKAALDIGMPVVGLLGRDGGEVRQFCRAAVCVPSNVTARIQEAHEFIGHALCAHIEAALGL
jgi:D-sedoheptulose 7-phosphate isomerase